MIHCISESKKHTNHNQNQKHHRNPTNKPNTKQKIKMKEMNPKSVKNLKFAKKHDLNKTQFANCKIKLPMKNSLLCTRFNSSDLNIMDGSTSYVLLREKNTV